MVEVDEKLDVAVDTKLAAAEEAKLVVADDDWDEAVGGTAAPSLIFCPA